MAFRLDICGTFCQFDDLKHPRGGGGFKNSATIPDDGRNSKLFTRIDGTFVHSIKA